MCWLIWFVIETTSVSLIPTSIGWRHRCACPSLSTRLERRHYYFDSISKPTFNTVLSVWVGEIRLRWLACDHILDSTGRGLIAPTDLYALCRWRCDVELFKICTWSLKIRVVLKLSKWSGRSTSSVVNTLIMRRLKALADSLWRMDPRFGFQVWVQLISCNGFILKCTSHRSWRLSLLLIIFWGRS